MVVTESWKVAVSLKEGRTRGTAKTYEAKSYDVLADCPVTMGDYLEERYKER